MASDSAKERDAGTQQRQTGSERVYRPQQTTGFRSVVELVFDIRRQDDHQILADRFGRPEDSTQ